MNFNNLNYDNESISSLKGADRVRKRPAVIFGSDGLEGCQHSVFEILSNSIDEAREGYGKTIEIKFFLDNSIEICDEGRGIPLDFNKIENTYNWQLIFCELYAGGKYQNNFGENYEFSLGINGLGACATQYSAQYMDVTVRRDGFLYSLHFEKGENKGGLVKKPIDDKKTGTIIKWKPDLEVFTDINIPIEYYFDTIKRQAVVNPGVKFILRVQSVDCGFECYEYFYQNGIIDYLEEISQGREITSIRQIQSEKRGRDRDDKPDYKLKMNFAFCFCNAVNLLEYYHNSSWLEHGGSPDKAVKSAFLYAIDQYIKNTNKYTKNENKLTFTDIQDSLILISSSFSTSTSYENQTKKAINNKFIQQAMTAFLREQLEIYFIENKVDAEKIAERVLINKRSRESAERIRVNFQKKLSGNLDVTNRVQKFVDCRSKDTNKREIYIVEGDSALGACKLGRDAEFQAIIPVRGKILNCLKADYVKVFKNDIILDLIKVLGCGVEVKTSNNKELHTFDINSLRWNKIIICTDADIDGFQIRTLILTMIHTLTPTLIHKGFVYIAESPLYEITTKKATFFAYDEKEKNIILSKLKDEKYAIQRSKGLGENQPDMMWQTTMNPQTRRLIKILPEDEVNMQEMFDLLLGDNLSGRKEFISANGQKYINLIDIS